MLYHTKFQSPAEAASALKTNDNDKVNDQPVWDLSHLYASKDDAKVQSDIESCNQNADSLVDRYKGKIESLSGQEMYALLTNFQDHNVVLAKLGAFAYLLFTEDAQHEENARFYQNVRERLTPIYSKTLFISLEINKLDDDIIESKFKEHSDLEAFRPFIRNLRVSRPYQLDDQVEQILVDKAVSGSQAWVKLFDESKAALRFDFDGEELTENELSLKLQSSDASVREKAGRAFCEGLKKQAKLMATITNVLAKDKSTTDAWRGYARVDSAKNIGNYIDDDTVDALRKTIIDAYPRTSHRYYKIKAKLLGMDKLNFWDRNAPIPGEKEDLVSWNDAKKIVLDSYRAFSPRMADIAQKFFDENWIDGKPRPGKYGGAFMHPVSAGAHPYILMSYQGKGRDVATLAHELGHGIHTELCKHHGEINYDYTMVIAETASVFGEMLTFKSLLKAEKDPKQRAVLLANKIEDMLNTVVRQISFDQFEWDVHNKRKNGELSVEELGKIWLKSSKDSLGDAFTYHPDYQYFWSYIPHFIHLPFYVYAYAFGDCLVNTLYQIYENGTYDDFEQKYIDLLAAGGTKWCSELLEPFGLDPKDPTFWQNGVKLIENFIDQLEDTLQEIES